MNYKIIGNSGLKVSELCLGAMTFGEDWGWGASFEDSKEQLRIFTEKGGNFIDTADFFLTGEHYEELDVVSRLNPVFPYSMLHNEQIFNNITGGTGNRIKNWEKPF